MKQQILIAIAIWIVALSGFVLYLNWRYQEVQTDSVAESSAPVETDSVAESSAPVEEVEVESATDSSSDSPPAIESPQYQCSGKVHCSEMTSCEEARFYLQNCPGTKMDGDRDGKPCEDWCGH
jgi:cytoskeletal protein RodZ